MLARDTRRDLSSGLTAHPIDHREAATTREAHKGVFVVFAYDPNVTARRYAQARDIGTFQGALHRQPPIGSRHNSSAPRDRENVTGTAPQYISPPGVIYWPSTCAGFASEGRPIFRPSACTSIHT